MREKRPLRKAKKGVNKDENAGDIRNKPFIQKWVRYDTFGMRGRQRSEPGRGMHKFLGIDC
ncbi:hypothetical protein E2C01_071462 [Portunus trituberculatus]|uniref:Uncharacterized protein n=1 Tax=Portunus trituberculatus TaxID=210409 RepID=A0A5B7I409_PORTR|nr:hypothetical protein [Portunus trituberculatus]